MKIDLFVKTLSEGEGTEVYRGEGFEAGVNESGTTMQSLIFYHVRDPSF